DRKTFYRRGFQRPSIRAKATVGVDLLESRRHREAVRHGIETFLAVTGFSERIAQTFIDVFKFGLSFVRNQKFTRNRFKRRRERRRKWKLRNLFIAGRRTCTWLRPQRPWRRRLRRRGSANRVVQLLRRRCALPGRPSVPRRGRTRLRGAGGAATIAARRLCC